MGSHVRSSSRAASLSSMLTSMHYTTTALPSFFHYPIDLPIPCCAAHHLCYYRLITQLEPFITIVMPLQSVPFRLLPDRNFLLPPFRLVHSPSHPDNINCSRSRLHSTSMLFRKTVPIGYGAPVTVDLIISVLVPRPLFKIHLSRLILHPLAS